MGSCRRAALEDGNVYEQAIRVQSTEYWSGQHRERERVRKFSQKFHGKLGSRVPPLQGGGGGNEEHHRHYY